MTPYSFVIADVFTTTPYGGNQLAVFPDARGLSARAMQTLAREFNFAESAFVFPADDPAHARRVRIFTPKEELSFAGHPTIGTAAALAHLGVFDESPSRDAFVLEEGVGPIAIEIQSREGDRIVCRFTLSAALERPNEVPKNRNLAAALSLSQDDIIDSWFASVGAPFCFMHLATNHAVDHAVLDRAAWASRLGPSWSSSVYFFAGHFATSERLYARMFAPTVGIDEDPATGSAVAALVAVLADRAAEPNETVRLTVD